MHKSEARAEPHPHEAPANLIDLLKHIQQFADFYRVVLGAKADPLFEQRFRQKPEKRFLSWFNRVLVSLVFPIQ